MSKQQLPSEGGTYLIAKPGDKPVRVSPAAPRKPKPKTAPAETAPATPDGDTK